jgi:MFS family permease
MRKAERSRDVHERAFVDQPPSPFAEPRPPLFTRNFVLLCLVTLGYFFSFFFFFPTLPFYIKHLGGREADVGLLIGISSLVSFSVKPLAGRWADRYGRVPVMTAAAGLFACGAVLHVWALQLRFLFILRILYGTAIGCFSTAAGAYLADVAPPARRGEATSYWGLVSSLAMGVVPPFALGLMSSATLHPLEEQLVTLLPGLGTTATWPDNFVLLFFTAAGIAFLACGLSRGMREIRQPAPLVGRRPLFAREALLPTAVNLCLYLTFTSYTSFLPLYARTLGLGNAGYLYSTYAAALLSTRLLSARVGDRYGRAAVIIPGLSAATVAMLVFAFAPNGATLYLGVSLYGLGIGLAQPGLSAFVIDHLAPERRGLGMSTYGQGTDLGMGLGGVLMGRIATQVGFTSMYLCGSGCIGVGLAIFLWGNRPVRR